MNRREVTLLQSVKSAPAVSILVPTHRTSPANKQDPIRVKNLIVAAADRLATTYAKRDAEPVLMRLESLAKDIDYSHLLDGLALFVNRDFASAHVLPFAVQERVVIDDTFATRDLVYALNRAQRYWLLVLSEQPTRLYAGAMDSLSEVVDEHFPLTFKEPEVSTSRTAGSRGFDKATLMDEKHKHFFRAVDTAFGPHAVADPLPLLVAGVEHYLAFFRDVSKHTQLIAGELKGNFDKTTVHELEKSCWSHLQSWLDHGEAAALKSLTDAIGAHHAALGIDDVWAAADAGRGAVLLVEQGYRAAAMLLPDGTLATSDSPLGADVIDDIVDEAIERVVQKGGRVVFVKDGALVAHRRIALILRY